MADDGMLMNFSFDTGSLTSNKPVFKGGRWKDRLHAKKGLKRSSSSRNPQPHGSLTGPNTLVPEKARQFGEEVGNERAVKKRKTNNGDSNEQPSDHIHANPKPTNGDVISSLFTSNPTTTSKPILFKPSDASDLLSPPAPSNAPLPSHLHNFTSLGLSPTLSTHLLQTLSLTAPTAIQKATIPQLLLSPPSDAFIQAETGSGKTLAYLLPILHHILALKPPPSSTSPQSPTNKIITRKSGLFALILAPTRELTHQISSVLTHLLHKSPHIVSGTVTGGATKNHEKARLRKGLNILVATPGRLADHLENTEVLDLTSVRWLVLDEGDRLMEMGFEEEVRKIVDALGGVRAGVEGKMARLRKMGKVWGGAGPEGKVFGGRMPEKDGQVRGLPERRMTVLCSATMKMGVQRLGEMSLKDAVLIKADPSLHDEDNESKEVKEHGAPTTNGTEKAKHVDDDENPSNETVSTKPEDPPFLTPSQLKQSYIIVPAKQRLVTLAALLRRTFACKSSSVQKAIVFVSCADSVEFLFEVFARTMGGEEADREAEDATSPNPPPTLPTVTPSPLLSTPQNQITLFKIHGSLPPPLRPPTLSAFRTTPHPAILLATDIAARGLDLPNIDLVIEYDAAFSAEEHLHRVGRTARAGKGGGAVGFLLPGGEEGFVDVLKDGAGAGGGKVRGEGAEDVLRKGFAPRSTAAQKAGEEKDGAGGGNWEARATAWQLDVERWVLADQRAGELARRAFVSHVRAYATHVAKERYMFDVKDLHLGHLAKAFALREKPGSMGRGGGGSGGRKDKGARRPRVSGGDALTATDGTERPGRMDHVVASSESQDAARKMRAKVREQMAGGASEFNIG